MQAARHPRRLHHPRRRGQAARRAGHRRGRHRRGRRALVGDRSAGGAKRRVGAAPCPCPAASASTSCSWSAAWPRRAPRPRRWSWPARWWPATSVGEPGRQARPAPRLRTFRSASRTARRRRSTSRAARSSWRRRSRSFPVDPAGLVCADLGASTGGFTDLLLQRGAARVHAVDVGYGQLHPRLRGDPRVVVHERVNARLLEAGALGEDVDLVVGDLSFISLRLVLPAVKALLRPGGRAILLVKPQFEVGKGEVGKGGVVREDAKRHRGAGRGGGGGARARASRCWATPSRPSPGRPATGSGCWGCGPLRTIQARPATTHGRSESSSKWSSPALPRRVRERRRRPGSRPC